MQLKQAVSRAYMNGKNGEKEERCKADSREQPGQ